MSCVKYAQLARFWMLLLLQLSLSASFLIPTQIKSAKRTTLSLVSMKRDGAKDKAKVWNTSIFPAKEYPRSRNKTILVIPPEKEVLPLVYLQTVAGMIGIVSGVSVAGFKLSVDAIRQFCYSGDLNFVSENGVILIPYFAVPVLGGVAVSLLNLSGEFSPGLRGVVNEIDDDSLSYGTSAGARSGSDDYLGPLRPLRKSLAAIFTLGTGNSLGPEGPGVEIGVAISRFWMMLWPPDQIAESGEVITAD